MATVPSDKLKAAETALTQIERQFGKGSIMRLGAKEFAADQRDLHRLDRRRRGARRRRRAARPHHRDLRPGIVG